MRNVCDESFFTWCYTWQGKNICFLSKIFKGNISKLPEIKNKSETTGNYLIKGFQELLSSSSHIIIVDAGMLSTMKNVEYLMITNSRFVMSMKYNNAVQVFKELKALSINVNEFTTINSDKFAMMT